MRRPVFEGLSLRMNLVPPTPTPEDDVLTRTTKLTNAQFLTLPSSPVVVVPAPGAGKWLVPVLCVIEADFSHGPPTFSSGIFDTAQGVSDIVVTWGENIENAFRAVPLVYIAGVNGDHTTSVCPPFMSLSVPSVAFDQVWARTLQFGGDNKTENIAFYLAGDNSGDFGGSDPLNSVTVTVYYFIRTFASLT